MEMSMDDDDDDDEGLKNICAFLLKINRFCNLGSRN
jgi:hypothetical protein